VHAEHVSETYGNITPSSCRCDPSPFFFKAPHFVNNLWDALDCQSSGALKRDAGVSAAGFTINPLSTRSVLDFPEVMALAPLQVLATPKVIMFVRTNIIKQAMSFLGKFKLVEGPCRVGYNGPSTKNGHEIKLSANIGKSAFEQYCNQTATYAVGVPIFAAAVAAEAQLRVDFDDFITTLGTDHYTVEYERVQTGADKEMQALYAWMGVPYTKDVKTRFVKKAGDDLNAVIENIEEIVAFVQGLDLSETECPLLQMLTTPHAEAFSECDYSAVVRSIQKSEFDPRSGKKTRELFTAMVKSGGRKHINGIPYGGEHFDAQVLLKVGPLNVTRHADDWLEIIKDKGRRKRNTKKSPPKEKGGRMRKRNKGGGVQTSR
jgi:hypothetical protein